MSNQWTPDQYFEEVKTQKKWRAARLEKIARGEPVIVPQIGFPCAVFCFGEKFFLARAGLDTPDLVRETFHTN